jgi:autotransporter-associated beta strand protein
MGFEWLWAFLKRTRMKKLIIGLAGSISLLVQLVYADTHVTGVPQLSSLPGAPYTVYLDFAGFNYSGSWGGAGNLPGNVPAFDNVTGSFGAAEQTRIAQVWAAAAQGYSLLNINVTTVDPAVAAGQAASDAQRQTYYDQTAGLMHTIMTPDNGWYSSSLGGVSFVGVTANPTNSGMHTNWDFAGSSYSVTQVAQPAIHENGHGFGLSHQSDYQGSTLINEYSLGDNNNASGTYAPIMGEAYYTQRGAWRVGDSDNGSANTQNDITVLLASNPGMAFLNDGIGHSLATASTLPLTGADVNFKLAKGIIAPASSTAPTPIGAAHYVSDYFSFQSDGTTPIRLSVNDGTQFLHAGSADPGVLLRSTLTILDPSGATVGTGVESPSTLSETFTGVLPFGKYFARISSYGGHTQTLISGTDQYNTTQYYDAGAFFLTGSGIGAPAVWAFPVNGNWSDPSKWASGSPNRIGALFNVPTPAAVTVSLDTPVTLGTLLFGNAGNASVGYTLSGSGSNRLTLDNVENGATISVINGVHFIDAPVALNGNLVVANGGTNSWTLSFGATGGIAQTGTGRYSLTMSGAGGKLILSGSNAYTGGTAVRAGMLLAMRPASLPNFGAAGQVSVSAGAILALRTGDGTAGWSASELDGLRTVANWMGASSTLGLDTTRGDFTYSSSIDQPLTLAKLGVNTLFLTGSNSHSGGTQVNSGVLNINADAALGAANGPLSFTGNGALQAGSDAILISASRTISIGSGATATIDTQAFRMSIAGPITGPGGLTKVGNGLLTLNAVNGYGGSTEVVGGTLAVGAGGAIDSSFAIAIGPAGTLDVTAINPKPFTISGNKKLTVNGTLVGNVNIGSGSSLVGAGTLVGGGTAAILGGSVNPGAGTLSIGSPASPTALRLGDNAVYAWGIGTTSGVIQINGDLLVGTNVSVVPGGLGGSLSPSTISTIMTWTGAEPVHSPTLNLPMAAVAAADHWTGGALTSNWSDAANWDLLSFSGGTISKVGKSFQVSGLTGSYTAPQPTSDVGIAPAAGVAVLGPTAGQTVNSLTIGDGGANTTSLSIQPSGPLTVSGTTTISPHGVLALGGSMTSATLASGGTVNLNPGGSLLVPALVSAGTSSMVNFNGGVLRASSNSSAFLTGFGLAVVGSGGAVIDSNGKAVTVGQALGHDTALGSSLDGGLTKLGPGLLVLTAGNTYTGPTTISGGSLQLGDGTGNDGSIAGSIVNNGSLVFNLAGSSAFAGSISGSGAVAMCGSGSLNLTQANVFAGGFALSNGTLGIGNDLALGNGAIAISGGVLQAVGGPKTIGNPVSGTNISVGGTNHVLFTGVVSSTGDMAINATNMGRTTFSGAMYPSGDLTLTSPPGTGIVTIARVDFQSGNGTIVIGSLGYLGVTTGPITVGDINGLNAAVHIDSFQSLQITGTNGIGGDFILGTSVSSDPAGGGTLRVAGDGAFGTSSTGFVGTVPMLGQVYVWQGNIVGVGGPHTLGGRGLTIRSAIGLSGDDLTITTPVTLRQKDSEHPIVVTNTTTFAGGVGESGSSGSDAVRLHKQGTGRLIFSGPSTYTGQTDVDAGTLQLATAAALPAGPLQVAAGATLAANLGGANGFAPGNLDDLLATSTYAVGASLALDTTNAPSSFTYSTSIAGSMTLVKQGVGVLLLSGSNDYAGGTLVTAGTLEVENSAALPDGTSLTIDAGGAFVFSGVGAAVPSGAATVPEPPTITMLGIVAAGVLGYRWRRRKRAA